MVVELNPQLERSIPGFKFCSLIGVLRPGGTLAGCMIGDADEAVGEPARRIDSIELGTSRSACRGLRPAPRRHRSVDARTQLVLSCQKRPKPLDSTVFWARSSAVEHYLDMVGVTGSIPVAPTSCRAHPGRHRPMKVRNSLKSLRSRHRDNRLVRRRGRVYIINKTNRRFKARQG